jgi:hypothetical protein
MRISLAIDIVILLGTFGAAFYYMLKGETPLSVAFAGVAIGQAAHIRVDALKKRLGL